MTDYTPPPGIKTDLVLRQTYTPPSGTAVDIYFSSSIDYVSVSSDWQSLGSIQIAIDGVWYMVTAVGICSSNIWKYD